MFDRTKLFHLEGKRFPLHNSGTGNLAYTIENLNAGTGISPDLWMKQKDGGLLNDHLRWLAQSSNSQSRVEK
jgi:hypothetical protein